MMDAVRMMVRVTMGPVDWSDKPEVGVRKWREQAKNIGFSLLATAGGITLDDVEEELKRALMETMAKLDLKLRLIKEGWQKRE